MIPAFIPIGQWPLNELPVPYSRFDAANDSKAKFDDEPSRA